MSTPRANPWVPEETETCEGSHSEAVRVRGLTVRRGRRFKKSVLTPWEGGSSLPTGWNRPLTASRSGWADRHFQPVGTAGVHNSGPPISPERDRQRPLHSRRRNDLHGATAAQLFGGAGLELFTARSAGAAPPSPPARHSRGRARPPPPRAACRTPRRNRLTRSASSHRPCGWHALPPARHPPCP